MENVNVYTHLYEMNNDETKDRHDDRAIEMLSSRIETFTRELYIAETLRIRAAEYGAIPTCAMFLARRVIIDELRGAQFVMPFLSRNATFVRTDSVQHLADDLPRAPLCLGNIIDNLKYAPFEYEVSDTCLGWIRAVVRMIILDCVNDVSAAEYLARLQKTISNTDCVIVVNRLGYGQPISGAKDAIKMVLRGELRKYGAIKCIIFHHGIKHRRKAWRFIAPLIMARDVLIRAWLDSVRYYEDCLMPRGNNVMVIQASAPRFNGERISEDFLRQTMRAAPDTVRQLLIDSVST